MIGNAPTIILNLFGGMVLLCYAAFYAFHTLATSPWWEHAKTAITGLTGASLLAASAHALLFAPLTTPVVDVVAVRRGAVDVDLSANVIRLCQTTRGAAVVTEYNRQPIPAVVDLIARQPVGLGFSNIGSAEVRWPATSDRASVSLSIWSACGRLWGEHRTDFPPFDVRSEAR